MDFVEMDPTAFLVGKESLDLEALFVPITGFVGQFDIGYQKDGFQVTALPASNGHDRAILLPSETDIGNTDLIAWTNQQIHEVKRQLIFIELNVLGGSTNVIHVQRLQSLLKLNSVKFAVSQEDGLAVFRQDRL